MVRRVIIRMLGVDPDAQTDAMSEEEIKIIINNSYNGGEINQTELNYMQNIFSFDETCKRYHGTTYSDGDFK